MSAIVQTYVSTSVWTVLHPGLHEPEAAPLLKHFFRFCIHLCSNYCRASMHSFVFSCLVITHLFLTCQSNRLLIPVTLGLFTVLTGVRWWDNISLALSGQPDGMSDFCFDWL